MFKNLESAISQMASKGVSRTLRNGFGNGWSWEPGAEEP
jgi:hypothetical protein